jgi:hypothetical protein
MRRMILMAVAALATVFTAPALAQTAAPQRGQVQISPFDQGPRQNSRPHSVNPSYDVYQNGQYVGSDPDPSIRLQLRRDHDSTEW